MHPRRRSFVRRARTAVAVGAVGLVLAACGGGADGPIVTLTAEPVPGTSGFATASEPTVEPSVSESASASEVPSASESERLPSDADRGRFVATYRPDGSRDLEHVATDVDNDAVEEIVFAYIDVDERSVRVAVAWWDGFETYAIEAEAVGTTADRIERLRVADANADGLVEIITFESGEGDAASLTVWQVTGRAMVRPARAIGGCHAGSATYGAVGATMNDRDGDGSDEIYATCDDTPLPRSAWSTDRYVWRQGAYRYAPSVVG